MVIDKVYKVAILLNGREIVYEEGYNVKKIGLGNEIGADKEEKTPIWKNPMNITIVPTKDGRGQIALNPTCTFGSNGFIKPVDEEKIVTIYDLDAKLNTAYEKVVKQISAEKSGIEIVPANVLPKMKDVSKHPALQGMKRRKR
jgi:hypothetical protein